MMIDDSVELTSESRMVNRNSLRTANTSFMVRFRDHILPAIRNVVLKCISGELWNSITVGFLHEDQLFEMS